jgi:hypothetical protein
MNSKISEKLKKQAETMLEKAMEMDEDEESKAKLEKTLKELRSISINRKVEIIK